MKIAITILLNIMAVQANSQWVIQQFHPDYTSISFSSGSTGYIAGDNGIIQRTTNNGHSWVSQYTGVTQDINAVTFADVNKGWAAGWGGTVLRTTNGGTSWVTQSAGTTDIIWDIDAARGDTAVAVGIYNKVFRTTNGGLNWQSQTLGLGTSSTYGIYFYSYTEGYICDGYGDVYSTNNAGLNWTYRTTAPSALFSIVRISSTIIACGNNGTIIRSSNAGLNWSTIPSGTNTQLFSVTCTSPTVFLIAADDGAILRSTNSGADFYEAAPEVNGFDLTEIAVCDSLHVIAAGDYGSVRYSSDAGANWTVKSNGDPDDIGSIHFPAPLTGYAVNNDGSLFKTTNGGTDWQESYAGPYNLADVWFVNPATGYICTQRFTLSSPGSSSGSSSNVLRTVNGGANWNEVTFNNISVLSSICFADVSTGWVLGASPVTENGDPLSSSGSNTILFKTTTAGAGWQPVHFFNEDVRELCFVSPQTGWACGFNGFMQKTTNGGLNWTDQSTGVSTVLYSVYFLNTIQGYACGGNGTILATTNGGVNWVPMPSGTSYYLYSIHFGSSSNGICIGEHGTRLRTVNGGLTWTNQPELSDMELGDCFMPTPLNAYVCGPMGYIANYGGIITPVSTVSTVIPSEFSLSQNYPNPFNPQTTIRFGIAKSSNVKLVIYNSAGEEVQTLVNNELNAGTHEYVFNSAGISSGVYFYRLSAGDFIQTKKMVLIK